MRDQYLRILEALRRPGGNTTVEMQRSLNIVDVRKRISELRQMGYSILDEKEPNAESGTHKRYWLDEMPRVQEEFFKEASNG